MATYLVKVSYNSGFCWHQVKGNFAIGYGFYMGQLLDAESITNLISKFESQTEISSILKSINGIFSVIITRGNTCIIFSDKSRFFTLFYSQSNDGLIITDNPETIINHLTSFTINQRAQKELLGCGFVNGGDTLIEGISQLEASQIIIFENEKLAYTEELFNYSVKSTDLLPNENLYNIAHQATRNAFDRFALSLKGRTAVVPLSGGYDSRMIVAYLRSINYPNVVCFTYGISSNPEVKISGEIAKKAGYPWYFIEYSDELIQDFFETNRFHEYWRYVSRYSSNFYMQEYYAAHELHSRGLIPEDAIFVPGHSGDLVGGSQLLKIVPIGIQYEEIPKDILQKKFNLNPLTHKKQVLLHISEKIERNQLYKGKLPYSIYEDWDIKEKIAKFNINSSRVFTFFGYEVRFPFWDDELMKLFARLPINEKIDKKLYNKILLNEYFRPLKLLVENELEPSPHTIRWQIFKNKIKSWLPSFVRKAFFKQHDNFKYSYFTKRFVEDAKTNSKILLKKGLYHNAIISQWLVFAYNKVINPEQVHT